MGLAPLDGLVARGRAVHAAVTVSADAFYHHAVERLGEDLAAQPEARIADLYLAYACSCGDPAALAIFESQHLARLDGILYRQGLTTDAVDELKQHLRLLLFVPREGGPGRIASFAGRGDLQAWLTIVALRETRAFRRARSRDDALFETLTQDVGVRGELEDLRVRYGRVFKDAVAAAVRSLEGEDRQFLTRCVASAGPLSALAEEEGVHRTTVARRFDQLCRDLRRAVRSHLSSELELDYFAVESVMRLYDSVCAVSLASVLGKP